MSIADSFGRTGFARFINSRSGRVARLVVGLVLIVWGFLPSDTGANYVVVAIGLVPLLAGALDLCLVSALLGGPISGERVRSLTK